MTDAALRGKIGDELAKAKAKEAQEVLDEHTRTMAWVQEKSWNNASHTYLPGGPLGFEWYAGSDWQGRAARLYDVAAKVAGFVGH